jgi:hypothetical protein
MTGIDSASIGSMPERRARQGLTVFLALYAVWCLRTPDDFHLLDAVDLPIHETGHLVFAWGGEFLHTLGGTLFQLMIPFAFAIYFWRRSDRHAASVALWWVAQNCWNIARYVADARAQELPLVGGGEHDWAYLLAELDRLPQDEQIARTIRLAGIGIAIVAIVLGWMALTRPPWHRA